MVSATLRRFSHRWASGSGLARRGGPRRFRLRRRMRRFSHRLMRDAGQSRDLGRFGREVPRRRECAGGHVRARSGRAVPRVLISHRRVEAAALHNNIRSVVLELAAEPPAGRDASLPAVGLRCQSGLSDQVRA